MTCRLMGLRSSVDRWVFRSGGENGVSGFPIEGPYGAEVRRRGRRRGLAEAPAALSPGRAEAWRSSGCSLYACRPIGLQRDVYCGVYAASVVGLFVGWWRHIGQ